MTVRVIVDTIHDAERLSKACNQFPYEMYLRAGSYCADPKSTLGVLAMMYQDKNGLAIDTGDMPDKEQKSFIKAIAGFVREDEE
ncbi:MAG: hypothetical protein Q4D04_11895 [Clostridia bacterium]|nr:hypothetical protein [Clostridia bacterium]